MVWLPNLEKAEEAARAAAERNGFRHGRDDIRITVERAGVRRLRVTIFDDRVGSFFYANLGGNDITLSRKGLPST